jgi:GNAT superfamily N-acetyltransferase
MSQKIEIVPITREQFMARAPFSKEDAFCRAFHSKADMQALWNVCKGVFIDGVLAAAIITSISQRKPHVANLQLLHVFHEFRGRDIGRILTLDSVRECHEKAIPYYRVSAEPEAVDFYRRCGFAFIGYQKSGCELSMFRMNGPRPEDGIIDLDDPVIHAACFGKKKGTIHEFHAEFGGQHPLIPEKAAEDIFPKIELKEFKYNAPTTPLAINLNNAEEFRSTPLQISYGTTGGPGFGSKITSVPETQILSSVSTQEALKEIALSLGTIGVQLRDLSLRVLGLMLEQQLPPPPVASPPRPAPAPAPVGPAPAPPVVLAPPTHAAKPARVKPPRPAPVDFLNPERIQRVESLLAKSGAMPWAINIRGTHGSGKSWIVRDFLRLASQVRGGVEKVHAPGMEHKDRPLGYILRHEFFSKPVYIIGQYETACGGCDSMSKTGALDMIYDTVERRVTEQDMHVLFEGIVVCSDFRRSRDLASLKFPLEIIILDVPLQTCVDNVNKRRGEKGKDEIENVVNITAKYEGNLRSIPRFEEAGVPVFHLNVAEAMQRVQNRFFKEMK